MTEFIAILKQFRAASRESLSRPLEVELHTRMHHTVEENRQTRVIFGEITFNFSWGHIGYFCYVKIPIYLDILASRESVPGGVTKEYGRVKTSTKTRPLPFGNRSAETKQA